MNECKCQDQSAGLTLGLILGILIGAIIAIVVYRKDNGKTFEKLINKIDELIKQSSRSKSSKKPVILPDRIIASTSIKTQTTAPKAKMFKKSNS